METRYKRAFAICMLFSASLSTFFLTAMRPDDSNTMSVETEEGIISVTFTTASATEVHGAATITSWPDQAPCAQADLYLDAGSPTEGRLAGVMKLLNDAPLADGSSRHFLILQSSSGTFSLKGEAPEALPSTQRPLENLPVPHRILLQALPKIESFSLELMQIQTDSCPAQGSDLSDCGSDTFAAVTADEAEEEDAIWSDATS